MSEIDDLSVFDDDVHAVLDELDAKMESTHECRICERALYGGIKERGDELCFQCWVRHDKAEAEYIAVFTHGGTR